MGFSQTTNNNCKSINGILLEECIPSVSSVSQLEKGQSYLLHIPFRIVSSKETWSNYYICTHNIPYTNFRIM
jgi:hypothetical protein